MTIFVTYILGSQNLDKLREYTAGYELIVLDEAQRIPNIKIGLKMIVDNIPGIRVLATGSASFDLSGQPKDFLETYSNSEFKVITRNNYLEFIS